MPIKDITCKTGLKKGLISKEIFEREVSLCKDMSKKSGGCCWGRCETCGVIPLLHKLYKGELIDNGEELKELKRRLIDL